MNIMRKYQNIDVKDIQKICIEMLHLKVSF